MTISIEPTPEPEKEAQDRAAAVEGIQRGAEAFNQGRFRHFSEFEAEQRAKYALPAGDRTKFEQALAKVPNAPPDEHYALP